jgi:hypothetical protein
MCFPGGIKNMQALQELNSIAIDIKAGSICVEEIGDLTKMRHLVISFLSNSGIIDKESYVHLLKKMVSSFQRLNKLQTLVVHFDNYGEAGHDVIFYGDDVVLEVPWCSASLRTLVLEMNLISRVPNWMKSLDNMEYLYMTIKKLDQESLCILGVLPVLLDLNLEIVNNVEDIPSTDKQRLLISNRYPYRSLRHFWVGTDPPDLDKRISIPMLTFEAVSMPKLEQLGIGFHADITISVSNGRLDFGLKHLSQLIEIECAILGSIQSILRVEAAIKKALDNHPNLPLFIKYHYPSTEGKRNNTDDNNGQSLTAALPLPTDLAFTIHHHSASLGLGPRHGRRRPWSKARRGATIHGQELVQGAPVIPDRIKGISGTHSLYVFMPTKQLFQAVFI